MPGFRNGKSRARAVARALLQLHKAGLLPEAKTAYRELLELAPDQFIALHLLGALES